MKLLVPFFHSEFDPLQLLAKFFWRISTLWRFWRFSVATLGLNLAIAGFLTVMDVIDIVSVFWSFWFIAKKYISGILLKKRCEMIPTAKIDSVKCHFRVPAGTRGL